MCTTGFEAHTFNSNIPNPLHTTPQDQSFEAYISMSPCPDAEHTHRPLALLNHLSTRPCSAILLALTSVALSCEEVCLPGAELYNTIKHSSLNELGNYLVNVDSSVHNFPALHIPNRPCSPAPAGQMTTLTIAASTHSLCRYLSKRLCCHSH